MKYQVKVKQKAVRGKDAKGGARGRAGKGYSVSIYEINHMNASSAEAGTQCPISVRVHKEGKRKAA